MSAHVSHVSPIYVSCMIPQILLVITGNRVIRYNRFDQLPRDSIGGDYHAQCAHIIYDFGQSTHYL